MKNLEVSFLVQGSIKQTVLVEDDMTPEQLQKLLSSGKAATSIEEDGHIMQFLEKGELQNIGTIISVDNLLEYSDFEVNKE